MGEPDQYWFTTWRQECDEYAAFGPTPGRLPVYRRRPRPHLLVLTASLYPACMKSQAIVTGEQRPRLRTVAWVERHYGRLEHGDYAAFRLRKTYPETPVLIEDAGA